MSFSPVVLADLSLASADTQTDTRLFWRSETAGSERLDFPRSDSLLCHHRGAICVLFLTQLWCVLLCKWEWQDSSNFGCKLHCSAGTWDFSPLHTKNRKKRAKTEKQFKLQTTRWRCIISGAIRMFYLLMYLLMKRKPLINFNSLIRYTKSSNNGQSYLWISLFLLKILTVLSPKIYVVSNTPVKIIPFSL